MTSWWNCGGQSGRSTLEADVSTLMAGDQQAKADSDAGNVTTLENTDANAFIQDGQTLSADAQSAANDPPPDNAGDWTTVMNDAGGGYYQEGLDLQDNIPAATRDMNSTNQETAQATSDIKTLESDSNGIVSGS